MSFTSMEAQNTSTCKAPEGLFASARDSDASINWQSAGIGSAYMVQWKSVRSTDWKTETATTNTLLLRGLQPCAEFEFRVKAVCSMTESSAYGESKKFKTLGCNTIAPCSTPREVKGETVENKAYFKWSSTGAHGYEVQYQDASNNGAWVTAVVTTNNFAALNLKTCTKYFFKVRSICTNVTVTTPVIYSEWSAQITVATMGCNTNTRCEPVRRLSVVSVNTGIILKWDSVRGATYDIQVKNIREGEWRTISGVRGNVYAFTGLASCSVFEARVRVNCSSTSSSGWSYSMRFLTAGCQPVCVTPRAVKVIIADTVAVISWTAPQASKFVLQYKAETDANWKSVNVANNVYVLTGLARCKKYVVRVQAVCSSTNSSEYSEMAKFETGGCHNDCIVPRQLTARVVDSENAAYLVWSGTGARAYIVEFKNYSDATSGWRRDTVTTTTLIVKNLLRCTKYGFRVSALCSNTVTNSSETYIFATGGCPEPCAIPKELKADVVEDSIAVMYWAGTAGKYEIQYRLSNATDNDWKSVTVASPAHKLVLHRCAGYYWRVRKICDNGVSDWSELSKFETRGCIVPSVCEIPRDLKNAVVSDSIAVFAWTALVGNKFEVQYRVIGSGDNGWHSAFVSTLETKLTLNKCKAYEWRVRKICDGGAGDWSASGKFETGGCVTPNVCEIPHDLKLSISTDSIASVSWIASVGSKFEIQYRIVGSGDSGWKSVFVSTLESRLILQKCKIYEWHVRKICDGGAGDWSANGKFETGGCIAPSVCPTPMNIKVVVVQDGISVTWSDMMERDTVVVQYASSADAAYNYVIGTTPNGVLLRGLAPCTTYKIRIVRKCPNGGVSIAYETSFKTPGVNCLTDGDAGVGVNSLQKRTAVKNIGISPNPGSEYIQVQYDLEEVSKVQIQLLNLQGQIVKQMDGGAQDAGTYMQVLDNLTNINQGMYFLVIRANGKVTTTQKWMKQ